MIESDFGRIIRNKLGPMNRLRDIAVELQGGLEMLSALLTFSSININVIIKMANAEA